MALEEEQLAESKVIIEDGDVKIIFSDEIENNGGGMTIEEAGRIILDTVKKAIEMKNNNY